MARKPKRTTKSKGIISAEYRKEHVPGPLARALHAALAAEDGIDTEALAAIAEENDIDPKRWSHLNPGQRMMNLGNVLRGKLRRDEGVTINGKPFKGGVK